MPRGIGDTLHIKLTDPDPSSDGHYKDSIYVLPLQKIKDADKNFHQGNIYQDDFIEVWENRFQPYRDRSWMKKGQCGDCKWFRYCQVNGMHLRDDNGDLILCHLGRLE